MEYSNFSVVFKWHWEWILVQQYLGQIQTFFLPSMNEDTCVLIQSMIKLFD